VNAPALDRHSALAAEGFSFLKRRKALRPKPTPFQIGAQSRLRAPVSPMASASEGAGASAISSVTAALRGTRYALALDRTGGRLLGNY
jgi:hypothetical protein